ncbi:hypothetical protein J2X16_001816 [Pelomonas aquatica]|uniref:DNA mimic protein DMP19 C-terminal domain-containing protein n=1 Tax=Pelomonas aquatica TaxID=431058 RepID=A0ABU1Z782_9BURK|nr:DUF4375 domain-containing protein [Pelomonas aquatica]MDR7296477.1 hypothetical protein [Pelomonas aquatica]
MTDDELLSALDFAQERMKAAGGMARAPEPIRVAMTVCTAQGIIDNGGLQYFYEADFEDRCPYSDFVEAYRDIGAHEAADLIDSSWKLIPFAAPHLFESKRQQWLDEVKGDDRHALHGLSDRLIGNKSVFPKLKAYILAHMEFFRAA